MIRTVNFLEFVENIGYAENHADPIPFNIVLKFINLVKENVCNIGFQPI